MTTTPNITITSSNGTQAPATAFPSTSKTTSFQLSSATTNSTAVPTRGSTATPYTNTTANSSSLVPPFSSTVGPTFATNTTNSSTVAPTSGTNTTDSSTVAPTSGTNTTDSSTVAPTSRTNTTDSSTVAPTSGTNTTNSSTVAPTSDTDGGTVIPTSSTKSSTTQVVPTHRTSVTAPGQTSTVSSGSSDAPQPSIATAVQLLRSIALSFRILNRSFNESLRDPVSEQYRSLSRSVLDMTICACRRKTRGKLDLFSTKDSYHPMAEYLQYQSHGRYMSPSGKPNPYSQVSAHNGAGTGTFTYTNPSATSDNL
uniref:SEA domain-containing protein n=1 Tax=Strigops habroptila TaxID=2489341 RepID=A0A672UW53_STRHB